MSLYQNYINRTWTFVHYTVDIAFAASVFGFTNRLGHAHATEYLRRKDAAARQTELPAAYSPATNTHSLQRNGPPQYPPTGGLHQPAANTPGQPEQAPRPTRDV